MADATRALLGDLSRPTASASIDSVACFVDLARFTTISEALGRIGSAGTERLVALINQFFTPAIDDAYELGGDVVGFGGDALTVLFPFNAVNPAVDWATQVMSLVDGLEGIDTPTGSYRLEAKIGISDGTQRTHLVGDESQRRAVTGGTAIDNAVYAESQVGPGTIGVLIDPDRLPTGLEDRAGINVLDRQALHPADTVGLDDSPVPESDSGPIDDYAIRRLAPARVVERLTAAGPELLDEHRPVTVLFVSVGDGSIHDDPEVAAHLGTIMSIVEAGRGSVLNIGSGDKGTTLLAAFGAPVAFSNQRSAAIFAASEIVSSTPSTCGVSTGLCFSGRVGSSRRWSYTLMGDVVNTAARLMTAAPANQVLVDEPTYHDTDSALVFGPPTELSLKGKERDVRASLLTSTDGRSEIADDLPLTGRVDELQTLESCLDDVLDGSGSSTLIVGESGVGKSRLTRELVDMARGRGFRVAEMALTNRRSARSYGPWQPVVFAVLGLAADAGPSEFQAALLNLFGNESPLGPILRDAMFSDGEPGRALAGVETKDAAEILDTALAELILNAANRSGDHRPLLLIADDAHDLDEASTRLLDRVRGRTDQSRVALVAIDYPDGTTSGWHWDHRIQLANLGRADAFDLAVDHQRKMAADIKEPVLRDIVERVGGNPQLIRLLIDHAASGADDLPNDVRSIVLARYDRLSVQARESLAMASVLGRHFSRGDFVGAFRERLDGRLTLEDLVADRLVEAGGEDAYSFASPLLWQVAYEASAHSTRTQAHRDVGLHIERLPATTVDRRVEDLAHHFGFTDDLGRHRQYFGPAARRAQRAFANEQAVTWFQRAIDAAENEDAADLRFDLAATLEHVGRLEDAAALFSRVANDDATAAAIAPRALASLAQLQILTDNFELAAETLRTATVQAEDLGEPAVTEWVFEKASLVHAHAGQFERAAELAARQLAAAEDLGEELRVAAALSNSGAAKSWLGDLGPARSELTQSLDIFLDLGALSMATETEMDLAMVALDEGNTDEAIQRLRNTHERAQSIGHRRMEAGANGNLALTLIGIGENDLAWSPALASASLMVEIGDIASAAGGFGMLGLLTMAGDDHATALGILARTIHIGRRLGSSAYRERAYEELAAAYDALGDDERAQRCRDQQAVSEGELSDAEVDAVAPLTPPGEMDVDHELAAVLRAADLLIAGLGDDHHE